MTDFDSWFRHGLWCLLESPVEGSRQGRNVIVQHRHIHGPEKGGSYRAKRYESEKGADGAGGWRHTALHLEPLNPTSKPIRLLDVLEGEIQVIAELLKVLERGQPCRSPQ